MCVTCMMITNDIFLLNFVFLSPIKQLNASVGVFTIGKNSPLTLNEVLTITEQPVFSLNFLIKL